MQKRSRNVSFSQQVTSLLLITLIVGSSLPSSLFAATLGANLISNPNFESATTTLTDPLGWSKAGFGVNDRSLVYPVLGSNSEKAAAITITSYTDGDAKWMFAPVTVTPGRTYAYSDEYLAGTTTTLTAEFFDVNNLHLAYAGFLQIAPSSQSSTSTWSNANATFVAPPGASSMTVFHALAGVGSLTIDNTSLSESVTPYGTLATVVVVNGGTLTPKDLTISVAKTNSALVTFAGSASSTFLTIDAGDTYTVNTPNIAHYKLSKSAGCSGVMSGGANANCLLTQTHLSGTSTILKIVTKVSNTHGRTNVSQDFMTTFLNGSTTLMLPGSESGQSVSVFPDTNYRVTVNAGQNYVPSSSPDCVDRLVEGDTATCEITLSDTAPVTFGGEQPNLIPNPGFERADPQNASLPLGWVRGTDWGTNIAAYVYPVSGASTPDSDISVGNAVRVSYASYTGNVLTSGDAKWYFTPVSIVPEHRYKFQDSYVSQATTTLVAEFFDSSHTRISLVGFNVVPPSPVNGWKIANAVFAAPTGAAYMTVYHQLNSTGSLTLDNASLTDETVAAAFPQGFVSLTFDDGYTEHFQSVKPILDAANEKGTFYIVSHNSGFGITDPSLEIKDPTNSGRPLGWTKTDTSNAVFRYPVPGHTGVGAEVSASTSDSGAAWYHMPTTVLDDQSYQFSHYYKSTGQTQVFIQVKNVSGQVAYAKGDGTLLSTKIPYANLPPANDWTQFKSINIFLPPGTVSVAVVHALSEAGTLTIDDANFGAYIKSMTQAQVLALQAAGHEIGAHTQTHADLNSLSLERANDEIVGSRSDLLDNGVSPVLSFAYPYGNNSKEVQQLAKNALFTSGRGVIDGYNGRDSNRYALFSKSVTADTKATDIEAWINKAVLDHVWLILTFHQINDTVQSTSSPYATNPKTLQEVANYLKTNNIAVRTVSEGAALMEGYVPPPSNGTNTPPVIAAHLNVEANATSSVGVVVSYTLPLVSDDHDTNLVATCAPPSGSLFVLGTTTVTCNTKDSSGSVAIPTAFVVHVTLTATSSNGIPPPAPISSGGGSGGSGGGGGGGGGGSNSTYWGCTNQAAKNYNRLANKDDGTCILTATTTTVSGTNTSTTTGSLLSSLFTSTHLGTNEQDKVEKEKGKGEVLGAKIYKFKHKMKMGSRGEEVGELQRYLFSRGYYFGPFTSYFGKLTQAAIKSFQKASQLEAVGYIGPKTLSLLNSATFAAVLTTTPNSLSIDSATTKQNNKK